jgi:hypothetical protein
VIPRGNCYPNCYPFLETQCLQGFWAWTVCLLSRRPQVRVLSGAWPGIPLFTGVSGLLHSAYTTFCRVRITAIRTFFGSKLLPKLLPASGRHPRLEQLLGKLQLNRGEVHDPRTRRHYAEGGKQTFLVHSEGLRSSEEGSSAHGQANGSRQEAEEEYTQETVAR